MPRRRCRGDLWYFEVRGCVVTSPRRALWKHCIRTEGSLEGARDPRETTERIQLLRQRGWVESEFGPVHFRVVRDRSCQPSREQFARDLSRICHRLLETMTGVAASCRPSVQLIPPRMDTRGRQPTIGHHAMNAGRSWSKRGGRSPPEEAKRPPTEVRTGSFTSGARAFAARPPFPPEAGGGRCRSGLLPHLRLAHPRSGRACPPARRHRESRARAVREHRTPAPARDDPWESRISGAHPHGTDSAAATAAPDARDRAAGPPTLPESRGHLTPSRMHRA